MMSNYGYIPAGPLADFWREHDKRQRATRAKRHYRHAEIVWAITMSADTEEEFRQAMRKLR